MKEKFKVKVVGVTYSSSIGFASMSKHSDHWAVQIHKTNKFGVTEKITKENLTKKEASDFIKSKLKTRKTARELLAKKPQS